MEPSPRDLVLAMIRFKSIMSLHAHTARTVFGASLFRGLWSRESKRWKAWIPVVSDAKRKRRAQWQLDFEQKCRERLAFECEVNKFVESGITLNGHLEEGDEEHESGSGILSLEDLSKLDIIEPKFFNVPTPDPDDPTVDTSLDIPSAPSTDMMVKYLATSPFTAVQILNSLHSPALKNSELPVVIHLDVVIDMKRESLRGMLNLPYSIGSKVRLLVFCSDDAAPAMIEAGADLAGENSVIEKIMRGQIGFDKCITTTEFMPKILKLAKILGPKKLMPNKRSGTIVSNLMTAIAELKSGSLVEFRAEGEGQICLPIGTLGSDPHHLIENMKALCKEVHRNRPKTSLTSTSTSQSSNQRWPPNQRQTCLRYFNTPDIRALINPVRQLPHEIETPSAQSKNSLFKSGSIRVPGLPNLYLLGNALDPTSNGYSSPWEFQRT